MAFITADRVKDTSTTTGTGNITVSGSAPFGYRTFSTVLSVNDTFYYCIQGQGTAEWEVGLGTYASTNQFARTTVLASSASGSAVSFSSGTKNVFITLPANKTLQFDASGSPTAGGILYGTGSMLSYSTAGTAGQVLVSGGSGAPTWSTVTGLGTVTSVNVSGGTTGLTTSGGPVTTSGTITLAGTLAAANGGTGLTSPGTSGNVLTSNGSAWVSQAPSGGSGTSISNGTSNVTIATSNGAITAATAGTTAMTINTSQNVGIGTSSPGNKLDVAGNQGFTTAAYVFSYAGGTSAQIRSGIQLDGTNQQMLFLTGTNERMRIDSSGNVGIGTSSPSTQKLTIESNGTQFRIRNTTTRYRCDWTVDSSGNSAIGSYDDTSAVFKLLNFYGSPILFNTTSAGAETARIDASGYLLLGYTSSNGAYRLQVNSQIFATSSTIATSDARYKQNVTPLTGALNIVKALRPVSFDWKQHPVHAFDTENTTVGFLAQEVQQVLADQSYLNSIVKKNECVIEPEVKDENGIVTTAAVTEEFLGIAEGNMIAILTAALQELSAKNDALEARLAALEAK